MITREDVKGELVKIGAGDGGLGEVEDEEAEMARMLDEKVGET